MHIAIFSLAEAVSLIALRGLEGAKGSCAGFFHEQGPWKAKVFVVSR